MPEHEKKSISASKNWILNKKKLLAITVAYFRMSKITKKDTELLAET